jgi:type II secretion system protein H
MGDDVEQLLADEERRFVLTPRRRGFTLIELAIVLVIFGILMQLAIPSFRSWLANGRVRTVAESLQNDLRQAQAEAVRRNRQVALVLTDSSPTIANPESTASTSARNWVRTGSHPRRTTRERPASFADTARTPVRIRALPAMWRRSVSTRSDGW